jgi:hypothetical protein
VYRRGVVAHFSRHLGAGEIEVIREALERVLAELPAVPRRPGGR